MPEATQPSTTPELPPAVSIVAKITSEQLKKKTEEHVLNLVEQGMHVVKMRSSLDLLMTRYHIGKSYMSMVADWYGELSWWTRFGTGVALTVSVALIGAVFNLGLLCAALTISIYCTASFFLLNHYNTSSARDQQLCDDIVEMETILGESIDLLNTTGDQLKDVLGSLATANVNLTEEAAKFETQISLLTQQILNFTVTVVQLGATKDGLLLTQGELDHLIKQVSDDLKMTYTSMVEKSVVLDNMGKKLAETHLNIINNTEKMTGIEEKFKQNLHDLCLLEEGIQEQLVILTDNVSEDKRKREEMAAELRLLVDATLKLNANTNEVIKLAEDGILSTASALEEYDRRAQVMDAEDQLIALEIENQDKENNELLARIDAQLAAHKTKKIPPVIVEPRGFSFG